MSDKDFNELLQMPKSSKDELIFEAEAYYADKQAAEKDLSDLILSLEEEYLKIKLDSAVKELHSAERAKSGEEELKKILNKCQSLAKELESFKKRGK